MERQILAKALDLARTPHIQIPAGSLLVITLLKCLNTWCTKRRANNYTKDISWDWGRAVVVVTGGSSGIGARMVSKFAEKRIKVLILDRNPPLGELEEDTHFYQVDLTDPEAITSVATQIRTDHGNPTVLINNVGMGNAVPLLELAEPNLRTVFDVNIFAPILLVQQFLPSMVRHNHGHVVNIASQASFATQATNVDYACTKSALLSFHEGLTQELRYIYCL